jgi:hypothetical protein
MAERAHIMLMSESQRESRLSQDTEQVTLQSVLEGIETAKERQRQRVKIAVSEGLDT